MLFQPIYCNFTIPVLFSSCSWYWLLTCWWQLRFILALTLRFWLWFWSSFSFLLNFSNFLFTFLFNFSINFRLLVSFVYLLILQSPRLRKYPPRPSHLNQLLLPRSRISLNLKMIQRSSWLFWNHNRLRFCQFWLRLQIILYFQITWRWKNISSNTSFSLFQSSHSSSLLAGWILKTVSCWHSWSDWG